MSIYASSGTFTLMLMLTCQLMRIVLIKKMLTIKEKMLESFSQLLQLLFFEPLIFEF